MELRVQATLLLSLTLLSISHAQNSPQDYLDSHNAAHKEVGVAPMQWSSTLESYALDYSNKRGGDCAIIHSNGPYGENIYTGWGEGYADGVDGVRYWYDEKEDYDYGPNQCIGGVDCLHYTQMVWRDSVRVGCAQVECGSNGGYFVTCSYDPPGNRWGERPY